MTLRSDELVRLFVQSGAADYDLPDGDRMLIICSPRCNVKIFWVSSGERAKDIVTANTEPTESSCALVPSSDGWAAAIASTEPLATDDAAMARTVISIASMVFDDVPELTEIRERVVAEKAAIELHETIHSGGRPPGRWLT